MAGRIMVMPERLAMKIAAGEVVERPASIVKELVENSLDAGATDIAIYVKEGGRRLVRVVDNGDGMPSEDAALACLRHATSKIETEEDLDSISTLGFRGEALPSIAAVSRLTIKTRSRGLVAGTCVSIEGGGEISISDVGCPEGTDVEVSDLFYNTPAREKFLRRPATEFGRITEVVKRIALARADVRFQLFHGAAKSMDTGSGGVLDRIGVVTARDAVEEFIKVNFQSEGSEFEVFGYVGRPELSFPTTKWIYTYINGRWFRSSGVNYAIIDSYRGTLDRGRFPIAVVYITVPSREVDVNVHPAKSEVRFKSPFFVYDMVKAALGQALSGGGAARAQKPGPIGYVDFAGRAGADRAAHETTLGCAGAYADAANVSVDLAESPAQASPGLVSPLDFHGAGAREPSGIINPGFLEMEVIGQLWGEFLLLESRSGAEFYLIDQHAAAERCAFERLRRPYQSGKSVSSQYLLVPERIETTPEESDVIRAGLETFSRLGFEIVPFGTSVRLGGETFLIKAVPDIFTAPGAGRLVKDVAEDITHRGSSARLEAGVDEALMKIACHSAVRGPRRLSTQEARALLKDLAAVDFAYNCPHGRPVVKTISRGEVEKMFNR